MASAHSGSAAPSAAKSPSYAFDLILAAATLGSQFMFIRVAVRELHPAAMTDIRLWIAAPIVVGYVLMGAGAVAGWRHLRRAVRPGFVIAALNAFAFTAIAWGEKHIDSGIAAIAGATVPIFVVVLVTKLVPAERFTGWRLAGCTLGLVGVGFLVGLQPHGDWWTVAGTAAVVLAAFAFALSQVYSQLKIAQVPGPALAGAALSIAAVLLLPFAVVERPTQFPSWNVVGSVVALAVLATATGQLLFYRMLRLYGVSRTTLVAYLIPVAGVLIGVAVLGETVTGAKVLGLLLILWAVGLASGSLRLRGRTAATGST
jgi:drug/metabolite transporter (DMT)-like permease